MMKWLALPVSSSANESKCTSQPKQVPPEATPLQLVFLLSGDPSAPVDVELQNGLNRLSFF
jgi:hypothetical protein